MKTLSANFTTEKNKVDDGPSPVNIMEISFTTPYLISDHSFNVYEGTLTATGQTSRAWRGLSSHLIDGQTYATVNAGAVYLQSNSDGVFDVFDATVKNWRGISVDQTSSTDIVYAAALRQGIYISEGGGAFTEVLAISAAPVDGNGTYYGLSVNSLTGKVFLPDSPSLYIQDSAEVAEVNLGMSVGDIVAVNQDNDNIYLVGSGPALLVQEGGIGDFTTLSFLDNTFALDIELDMAGNIYVSGSSSVITAAPTPVLTALEVGVALAFKAIAVNNTGYGNVGDAYAVVYGGDIYKRTGPDGEWVALNQTSRNWSAVAICTDGEDVINYRVFAAEYGGDIYLQPTGGTGDFAPLGQTSRNWSCLGAIPRHASFPNEPRVCAGVNGGDLYYYNEELSFPAFEAIGGTSRNWSCIYFDSSTTGLAGVTGGGLYYGTFEGDIFGGAFDFEALWIAENKNWTGICTGFVAGSWKLSTSDEGLFDLAELGDLTAYVFAIKNWSGIARYSSDIVLTANGDDIYEIGINWETLALPAAGYFQICINKTNNDFYVASPEVGVYKRAGGSEIFVCIYNSYAYGVAVNETSGDVYISTRDAIYKQAAGAGAFVDLEQEKRSGSGWQHLDIDQSTGNVFAVDYLYGLYCQYAGQGNFSAYPNPEWNGVTQIPALSLIYACSDRGIHLKTGAGAFQVIQTIPINGRGMDADLSSNDVYLCDYGGYLYKQTAATGLFVALTDTLANWVDVKVDQETSAVYALTAEGIIYAVDSDGNLEFVYKLGVTSSALSHNSFSSESAEEFNVAATSGDIYSGNLTVVPVAGIVKSWGTVGIGNPNPESLLSSRINNPDFSATLINCDTIPFYSKSTAADPIERTITTLYQHFKNNNYSDKDTMFVGVTSEQQEYDELLYNLNLRSFADNYNLVIGEDLIITEVQWPAIHPDAIGKMLPIIYGQERQVRCLPIVLPKKSVLSTEATTADAIIYLEDTTDFGTTGEGMVGTYPVFTVSGTDGIRIQWNGKTSTSLTGVSFDTTGVTFPAGTVVRASAVYTYLHSGHPVDEVVMVTVKSGIQIKDIPLAKRTTWTGSVYSETYGYNSGSSISATEQLGVSLEDATIVTANIKGWKDDASGTITGVANSLIERPGHVIKHIAVNYCGRPISLIDSDSFDDSNDFFSSSAEDYNFSLPIYEPILADTLFINLARQCRSIVIYFPDGKLGLKVLSLGTSNVDKTIYKANIVSGSLRVKRSDSKEIINKITFKYNKRYTTINDFIFTTFDSTGSDASIAIYGEKKNKDFSLFVFDAFYWYEFDQISLVLQFWEDFLGFSRRQFTFSVFLDNYDVLPGDKITIVHSLLDETSVTAIVTSVKYLLGSADTIDQLQITCVDCATTPD